MVEPQDVLATLRLKTLAWARGFDRAPILYKRAASNTRCLRTGLCWLTPASFAARSIQNHTRN